MFEKQSTLSEIIGQEWKKKKKQIQRKTSQNIN